MAKSGYGGFILALFIILVFYNSESDCKRGGGSRGSSSGSRSSGSRSSGRSYSSSSSGSRSTYYRGSGSSSYHSHHYYGHGHGSGSGFPTWAIVLVVLILIFMAILFVCIVNGYCTSESLPDGLIGENNDQKTALISSDPAWPDVYPQHPQISTSSTGNTFIP